MTGSIPTIAIPICSTSILARLGKFLHDPFLNFFVCATAFQYLFGDLIPKSVCFPLHAALDSPGLRGTLLPAPLASDRLLRLPKREYYH
jgi:hypothetical protein